MVEISHFSTASLDFACGVLKFYIALDFLWTVPMVSNSIGMSIGFVKCASIPLYIDSRLSLSKALAERAIMGICANV